MNPPTREAPGADDAPRRRPAAGAAWWAAMAAASVLVCMAAFSVDFLPTNDGPQHMFATYAHVHMDDATRGYARYLERGAAITSLGFDWLYRPLLGLFDWRAAHQLALAVIALTWAWGTSSLAHSLGRPWLGLLGFATAFQWALYMGLYSFLLALGCGLFIIGLACRPTSTTGRMRLLLAMLLFVQSMMHVFAALLSGLVIALVMVTRADRGRRLRELPLVAAMGLPAAIPALLSLLHPSKSVPHTTWTLLDRVSLLAGAFATGPAWRSWPPVVLAGLGLVLATRAQLRGGRARGPGDATVGLVLSAWILIACAVLLPVHLDTWQFFCVRFTPLGILLGAIVIPLRAQTPVARAAIGVGLFVYTAAANGWAFAYHRDLRASSAVALSGLSAPIKRDGPRLLLNLDGHPGLPAGFLARTVPFATPLHSLGVLYTTAQGGVAPNVFASDTDKHVVTVRRKPAGPIPDIPPDGLEVAAWLANADAMTFEQRRGLIEDLLSFSPGYDDVILHGAVRDADVVAQRQFLIDFERRGADHALVIARPRFCPLQLVVHDRGMQRAPLLLETAWRRGGYTRQRSRIPGSPQDGKPRQIRIDHSPCGPFFVRLIFDHNEDGKPSPGDAVCDGADAAGFLAIDVHSAGMRTDCSELTR